MIKQGNFRWLVSLTVILLANTAAGQAVPAAWPLPPPPGPYSYGYGVSGAVDDPVAGFVGPYGDGVAPYAGLYGIQQVNPIFVGWATQVVNYSPANPDKIVSTWTDSSKALGPVTGDVNHVVSLGDLSAQDLAQGKLPGSITLAVATGIGDGVGHDFVLFGNSFAVGTRVWAKMAYVEVSSDGTNFARFPSINTNPKPSGTQWPFMTSDPTKMYNLFGKALNAYGASWGTPFDLADLRQHPSVLAGLVDLSNIRYVRIVAVIGAGTYTDAYGDIIYGPWPTSGSPGPEVQAVGVLHAALPPAAQTNSTDVVATSGQNSNLVSSNFGPTPSAASVAKASAASTAVAVTSSKTIPPLGYTSTAMGGVITVSTVLNDMALVPESLEHDANALLVAISNTSDEDAGDAGLSSSTDPSQNSDANVDGIASATAVLLSSSADQSANGDNSNPASVSAEGRLVPQFGTSPRVTQLPLTPAYPFGARMAQHAENVFDSVRIGLSKPWITLAIALTTAAGMLVWRVTCRRR